MKSTRNNRELALQSSQEAHEIQIANKLLDEIEKLLLNQALSERRWIWELLQNAKDVSVNEKVDIEIKLCNDYLSFSHSGRPFRLKNLVFLIEQTSSKERATKDNIPLTTGKFGTGFMTTHLLSKVCEISGVYEREIEDSSGFTYQRFRMLLKRDADTQKGMINNVKKSFEVFEELDNVNENPYLINYKPCESCDTTFKYILDKDGLLVANHGLKNLEAAILTTMAFIKEIRTVDLVDLPKNIKKRYKLTQENEQDDKMIRILTFEVSKNGVSSEEYMILAEGKNIGIAIDLTKGVSGFELKGKHLEKPVLYVDFPLVGSEEFSFPVYINSHLFNPNEPRSSIILIGNSPKVIENRAIFESSLPLFEKLVKLVEMKKFKGTQFLFLTKGGRDNDDWFLNKIQIPMRMILSKYKLIETNSGMKRLEEIVFPYCKKGKHLDKLYDLLVPLKSSSLPIKSTFVEHWSLIIDNTWENQLGLKIMYSVEDTLMLIGRTPINSECFREISYLDYLKNVLKFLNDHYDQPTIINLLNKYVILVNQSGERKPYNDLKYDACKNLLLKKMVEYLGFQINAVLLDKSLNDCYGIRVMPSISDDILLSEISAKVGSLKDYHYSSLKNKQSYRNPQYNSPSYDNQKQKLIQDLDWGVKANRRKVKAVVDKVLECRINIEKTNLDWLQKLRKIESKPGSPEFQDYKKFKAIIEELCYFWAWRKVGKSNNLTNLKQKLMISKEEELFVWLNEFYARLKNDFTTVYLFNNIGTACLFTFSEPSVFKLKKEDFQQDIQTLIKPGSSKSIILQPGYHDLHSIQLLKDIYHKIFNGSIEESLLNNKIELPETPPYKIDFLPLKEFCKSIDIKFKENRENLKKQGCIKEGFLSFIKQFNPSSKFLKTYFPFLGENIPSLMIDSLGMRIQKHLFLR